MSTEEQSKNGDQERVNELVFQIERIALGPVLSKPDIKNLIGLLATWGAGTKLEADDIEEVRRLFAKMLNAMADDHHVPLEARPWNKPGGL